MHVPKCSAYLLKSIFVAISAFVKLTGAINPSSMKCENTRKAILIVFSYHTTCRPDRKMGVSFSYLKCKNLHK